MSISKFNTSSTSSNLKSAVWVHFERNTVGQLAQCRLCKASLKCTGGSTKSLHTHLQSKHQINLLKRNDTLSEAGHDPDCSGATANTSKCSKTSETSFTASCSAKSAGTSGSGTDATAAARGTAGGAGSIKKYVFTGSDNSMEATVSRLIACDGMSFNVIATSPDLRRVLETAGFCEVPKSHTSVRNMVMTHAQKVRSFIKSEIATCKKTGQKFSLTFDEWSSNRNRRYMIVNVHENGPKFWSLGLVRVRGTMPATKCVDLLKARLHEFELDLCDDIVAIVTDGASVMCKVGKIIEAEQHCVTLTVFNWP